VQEQEIETRGWIPRPNESEKTEQVDSSYVLLDRKGRSLQQESQAWKKQIRESEIALSQIVRPVRKTLQGSETEVPERILNPNDRPEKESVGPSFLF